MVIIDDDENRFTVYVKMLSSFFLFVCVDAIHFDEKNFTYVLISTILSNAEEVVEVEKSICPMTFLDQARIDVELKRKWAQTRNTLSMETATRYFINDEFVLSSPFSLEIVTFIDNKKREKKKNK